MKLHTLLLLFLVTLGVSCTRNGSTSSNDAASKKDSTQSQLIVLEPVGGSHFKFGDNIHFKFGVQSGMMVDSSVVYVGSKRIFKTDSLLSTYVLDGEKLHCGQVSVKARFYLKDKSVKDCQTVIYVVSDVQPESWSYKVLKTYPHDIEAYTQGLLYNNGFLYESTGLKGKSSIRKYTFPDLKIVYSNNVDSKYFAEGLALYQNKLYQLTWQEQTCFVYNSSDLQPIKNMSYSIAEGWGLVTYNQNFLMSDGSSNIYIIDPETFNVVDQFGVSTDQEPVKELNELEIADGYLFANIYGSDNIAVIEIGTGKVKAMLDMSGLLSEKDKHANIDVLNGIALLPNGNLLITGKNWPKMFEISLVKGSKKTKK
jgi:glutamine cyclotransferase